MGGHVPGGGPFDFYPVGSTDIDSAADETTHRTKAIDALKVKTDQQEKSLVQAVEGTLKSSAANAVKDPAKHADDVNGKALFAAACLREFGHAVDKFNFSKKSKPRCVSKLNSVYDKAAANNFGVDDPTDDKTYKDASSKKQDDMMDDFLGDVGDAGKAKLAELKKEYHNLEGWLDGKAQEVSSRLKGGPSAKDLKHLYAIGALPSWATVVYPNVDFEDVKIKRLPYNLRRLSKKELIAWMHDHPKADENLVEALEQLRPKATDERVVSADIITLSASATVGGTGKGQIKVLVQHLANGQVRVSVVEGVSGGAGVAIGAYGELDLGETEFGSGAMAGVTGLAGLQLGNSWEIPPDETDELLIGLYLQKNPAAKLAGEAGSKGLGLADFLTPDEISAFGHTVNLPVDEMHHVVQHYTDYEVPTPDRTRIDVTGSGDAYAKLGLPYGAASAGVEAQANVAIGAFRERDGDVGVRYHVDGNVSGETHLPIAKLTGGPGDTPSGSLNGGATVEVTFDENGEPKEIHTQAVYGTGEHQTMQSGTIDLDGKQMKDDAVAVVKALHNPTPENLANVKDIDLSDWANGAEYTRAELDLRGEDYGASGGASIPQTLKGVGGSLSVKHQHIDYDYGPDPS